MRNKRVVEISASAMFIALVTAATFINVPFPGAVGGLVHLGTVVMLIIAMRYGKVFGMISGGIGMALFDVLSGYAQWAPGTLVVRLIMGYVVGLMAHHPSKGQGGSIVFNLMAWLAGLIIMIVGYYLYEAIFLTNFGVAFNSVWGNVIQFAIGLAAPFAAKGLKRLNTFDAFLTE